MIKKDELIIWNLQTWQQVKAETSRIINYKICFTKKFHKKHHSTHLTHHFEIFVINPKYFYFFEKITEIRNRAGGTDPLCSPNVNIGALGVIKLKLLPVLPLSNSE